MTESVIVLGGGLSGCSAGYALAQAGLRVCVIERAPALGGLGGSFERDGHFYPLGYHHILRRDRTLLYFLELMGALEQVHWCGASGCYSGLAVSFTTWRTPWTCCGFQ